MSEINKLKVAILWHMHQPYYFNPLADRFAMPWTRFHGLKDYLDMPLLAAEQENIRVTFNLVPSLLDQLDLYCAGKTDRHQDLSRIPVHALNKEQKEEILSTFFSANFPTMIEPFIRYRQLFRKRESCGNDLHLAAEIFSSSEIRDLQVWANLVWIDPMFRSESPFKALFEKGKDFSEEDKQVLLDAQIDLLKRIIPTYQKLYNEGRIDISFTPYYHPILPLLADTDSAREAIPDIALPVNRFSHPEDATWHIREAAVRFKKLFGKDLQGMWPSEGSVSEKALELIAAEGITWAASDQEVLHHSGIKSGIDPKILIPHTVYHYENTPNLKLFFRDKGLSDRIGFVYSNWEPQKAVADFMDTLNNLRELLRDRLDEVVVPIILDGENAWEYFMEDGMEFLRTLYRSLAEHEKIETVFFSEAAKKVNSKSLPRLFAGSWISHDFKIWIGHSEDNAAWDLVSKARGDLEKFVSENPGFDSEKIENAWRQIYFAEGSDWCWWYGDDHISEYNAEFDNLFRTHLAAMYRILELAPPAVLSRPIHKSGTRSHLAMPESLVTPVLDGRLTHYYEWSGAGMYDCRKAGQAMHRADRILAAILFAFDYDNLYIRLDFEKGFNLNSQKDFKIVLDFKGGDSFEIPLSDLSEGNQKDFEFIYKQLLETKINRERLLNNRAGRIELFVNLYAGSKLLEKWPSNDPIVIDIPEREKEIFWQV